MDAVQSEVVTAVVTTLGNTVATDAWEGFKKALSRILGREAPSETEHEEARLERAGEKLASARHAGDEDRIARIDAAWSERILDFLEDHPEGIDALRSLVSSYGSGQVANAASHNVINNNLAMDDSTILAPGVGDVNIGQWPGK